MATLHVDSSDGDDSYGNSSTNTNNNTNTNTGTGFVYEIVRGTLLHLLSNSLVLSHTTPYLAAHDVLRLAATNKAFRYLLYSNSSVFRYLDLSRLHAAVHLGEDSAGGAEPIDRGGQTWRHEQIDENLTEDEFYSGPLRGAFRALRRPGILSGVSGGGGQWLAGVHTLILNNVSVTAELVHEILRSPEYNVRILSLRNAKHCNEVQLQQILRTACRPSRPDGTPKLRGLYIFGGGGGRSGETGWENALGGYQQQQQQNASSSASGLQPQPQADGDELWYRSRGRVLSRTTASAEWATTLLACRDVLAFDGVLCNGPRHANSPAFGKIPSLMSGGGIGGPGGTGSTTSGRISPNHRPPASPPHAMFAMAHFALDGCAGCGTAPEGWTTWGSTPAGMTIWGSPAPAQPGDEGNQDLSQFPMLWPPPLLSSNVRVAMCPEGESVNANRFSSSQHAHAHDHGHSDDANTNNKAPSRFIARCEWCVYGRLCALCHRWWCESCMSDQENAVPWTYTPASATTGGGSSSSVSHKVRTKDGKCSNCRR
ncbi:hypothetical protein SCUCBS95973_001385 [Sporothrix curviconia]|uniref:Ubiquitin fusion degradation protein n=1 Tax=Sporothrix curviconia TaxID=1260050 RepID=A0ABP0AY55_9PEZI